MRWRPDLLERGTVLGPVKAWPGNGGDEASPARRPALTTPVRGAFDQAQAGKERRQARTKERDEGDIDDLVSQPVTRRGLREERDEMEDRSSRRMRTLVTQMARSRPVR